MKTTNEFLEELKEYIKNGIYKYGRSRSLLELAAYHDILEKIEQFQEAQEETKTDDYLKLEPCGFCGEIPEVFRGTGWAEVRCRNKKCEYQPTVYDGSESTSEDIDYKRLAIDRWNSQHC